MPLETELSSSMFCWSKKVWRRQRNMEVATPVYLKRAIPTKACQPLVKSQMKSKVGVFGELRCRYTEAVNSYWERGRGWTLGRSSEPRSRDSKPRQFFALWPLLFTLLWEPRSRDSKPRQFLPSDLWCLRSSGGRSWIDLSHLTSEALRWDEPEAETACQGSFLSSDLCLQRCSG